MIKKQIGKIKKENLASIIVDELCEFILENRMGAGDKLPTEHELAEKFGVSRNAIREALKAMEVLGIVASRPKTGIVLTGKGLKPHLLPFAFGILSDHDTFRHMVDLRVTVESMAVNLAIANASDKEIEELIKIADESDKIRNLSADHLNDETLKQVAASEVQFHRCLIGLSHNPILIKLGSLWSLFFSLASQLSKEDLSFKRSIDEKNMDHKSHKDISIAIQERDVEKAKAAITSHLQFWTSEISKVDHSEEDLSILERIYMF